MINLLMVNSNNKMTMIKKYKLLVFIITIFCFGMFGLSKIKAAECGGGVVCACGDTVIASTTLATDLDCSLSGENGLIVGADNIVIDGADYTITGGGSNYGLYVFGRNNVLVQNLNISNFRTGILLYNTINSVINNTTVNLNTYYGIYLTSSSSSNTLTGNTVSLNSYYGIYIENSSSNTLTGNIMSGNLANLYVQGQFNNIINTTNKVEGKSVYYLYDNDGTAESPIIYDGDVLSNDIGMFWCVSCKYVQVKNATLSINNYAGVYFYDTTSSTIDNVIANLNSSYGIYLTSSSSSNIISNNTANSNSSYGIYLTSSSSSNIISNNTANSNSSYGIYLYNSSSNIISNNTANLNKTRSTYSYGIYLVFSPSNILTNNTANSNSYYGIYLYGSPSNTLTNNIANLNSYYGIYLYNSSSNIISNNTANSNSYYGIYLDGSSSNTITENTISNNKYDIFDNAINAYSSNRLSHNIISKMLTFEELTRTKDVNDLVSFDISMFNLDNSICSDCFYSITTSPFETVSTYKNANRVMGNFTVTKSGIYSLIFIVTDSSMNATKKRILFFVGDTNSETTKYYLRGVNATHGQPVPMGYGNDAKSMLLTPAINSEGWDCGYWIQNSPDIIPNYPLANLSDIDTYSWYKQLALDWAYIGVQKYFTYDEIVDVSSFVPEATDYAWINRNFTNLNWAMDYPYFWYRLSLKLTGDNPYWITFPSSEYSNQSSYVNFTYQYTTTPAIKFISNDNIMVLSATTPENATSSASIVLDNPNTFATSTTLVLTDFKRPFLNSTSVIDSTSTTTLTTTIGAGSSSTLDAVAMDIVPSYGSVEVSIDTWNTTGTYYRKWTEKGSDHDISTSHIVGDLRPSTNYIVKVGGILLNEYTSNSSGQITFTYDNGYSIKEFEVIDNASPVITILGENPTSIYINSAYTDSGATASDVVDDNLTNDISRISNVNTNIIGSYTVVYTVSDTAGNIATSTRIVNVILRLGGGLPIHTLDIKPKKKQNNLIKDNQVFKYKDDPKIYLLENSIKRWIKDEYTFNKLGYKWSDIIILEEDENSYSAGEDLSITKLTFQFTKTLKLKSAGNDVIQLQTILKKLGYFTYPKITNYYGSYTADAVGRFQKANKLKITKTLDKDTMKELNNLL